MFVRTDFPALVPINPSVNGSIKQSIS